MLTDLEYEVQKLINLINRDNKRRCCSSKQKLMKSIRRVQTALELEKKKSGMNEDLEKIESLLEELLETAK